jgi:hypothetical protein
MPAQPREILEINFRNPEFNRTDDWAKAIARAQSLLPDIGGGLFPFADYEWTQVLAPHEEYDDVTLVGATGWMINPHHSHADFPFTHPFVDGSSDLPADFPPVTDWEFHLALDRHPTNPQMYQFLLAEGNRLAGLSKELDRVEEARRLGLHVPDGLLGVEIDGAFVPPGFKAGVKTGDRVAVFGRWIVDTAHKYRDTFRAEIHPPLLIACASIQSLASAQPGTRVLFTSRPYLVGQRFTVDTDDIYDDSANDDGTTLSHFANEYAKVTALPFPFAESYQVQAHPKIKSYPFRGVHLLHIKVRPPAPEDGRPIAGTRPRLAVSFQFTVRSGCAVQVASLSEDTIDVLISLSDAGYKPPKLPPRVSKKWSREAAGEVGKGIGLGILLGEASGALLTALQSRATTPLDIARILLVLERGIKSDLYAPLEDVHIEDARHAVTRAWANEVPSNAGIVHNDDQPFPIFGWLEATWQLSGFPPL